MNKEKACCFIGHRKISSTEELKAKLCEIIEELITDENVKVFLFGSRSQFDDLCLETVTKLKQKHPEIKRIYARAEYPYITEDYLSYLIESYDDTYYSEKILNAGAASYVERNTDMIDKSDVCIFYYDENYLPPRRKSAKRAIADYQPKSGTKIAYDYAHTKKKSVINICK